MTAPDRPDGTEPPPADPLDELASARLDGAAAGATGEAEALDAATEAEVARRLARFARVRDVLATPVPVDAEAREAAIAAALAAAGPDTGELDDGDGGDDELAERRERREQRARRGRAGLRVAGAAAAVVAVVALGAALLRGLDADGDGDTAGDAFTDADMEASLGEEAEQDDGGAIPDGRDAAEPVPGADDAEERSVLGELGGYGDVDELLAALARTDDGASTAGGVAPPEAATDPPPFPCAGELPPADRPAEPFATASVAGRPVAVWATGSGQLLVVDAGTCEVLGRGER